jgi:hypothetical protein
MRRRQFIALFGGASATWPLTARAQGEPLRRVAILEPPAKDTPGAQERHTAFLKAFEQLVGRTDATFRSRFARRKAMTSKRANMPRNW